MLRVFSRRLGVSLRGSGSWMGMGLSTAPEEQPPQPPAHLPAEIFEWDYLLDNASDDAEKQEIQQLRKLHNDAELLNRKEFKLTVDWDEFEGKVPQKILDTYKGIYADAVKKFEAGEFDAPFDEAEWNKHSAEQLEIIKSIEEAAKARVAELDKEIEMTEGKIARLATATLDEEMAADPELAKRVDEAVSEELGYTK